MDISAKILVLGLSQAGKSSFINYFIGADEAEVGKGKPCTKGFCKEYTYNNGRYPIKIYDNEGFEAAIASNQKGEIIDFVKENNNSGQIMNWFHTIFYVTSAKKRFEDFERDFILELSNCISQNIHIIITCCDGVSNEVLEAKEKQISYELRALGDKLHIFKVVSISMKKRNGDIVEPSGKEKLIESVFPLFWEDICGKISKTYAREAYNDFNSIINNLRYTIYNMVDQIVSIKGLSSALNDDDSMFNSMSDNVEEELDDAIESLRIKYNGIISPLAELLKSYYGTVSDCELNIDDLDIDPFTDDDFDFNEELMIEKYFPSISVFGNNGDANIGTFFGAIGELFTIKKRLKSAVDDMVYCIKRNLLSEEEIETRVFNELNSFIEWNYR